MTHSQKDTIPELLVRNIPRGLVMAIEEALGVGAQRAFGGAKGMDQGHLPHIVGQLRHFHMNESFHRALTVGETNPTPIRGNGIVSGRSGVFTLARFNIPEGFWVNGRRSHTRRQMSFANKAIEPLVQPELFEEYSAPSEAVAFFVACFSGSLHVQPESPLSIQIAVPDRDMRGWLFREPVSAFLQRYELEQKPATQDDLAKPKLKKDKKQGKDGTTS
ncbi:alpha/beta hydrolase [Paraburkholderia madseniana]|uniref:Alpha/beta hydrolase n=1 Tax=Paraburkholderia madseniana TaxID=2599607 RepID=A0A6N6WHY0_9BURK|nr:alpha/beta hydrolase [Paraburkholderia madseniana]KAE8759631.1 alpha/beta hydrolase [Paraburkholderia madseniana]